jgi:hypothetical protein
LLWIIWGVVFYRYARADDPEVLTKRATRWLLRGSILELLVAVPSHIVVRHRNDCCAPIGTFWGIVTGISIMLLSFGPGVFFLFVERCQRLHPPNRTASATGHRTGQFPVKQCKGFKTRREPTADPGIDRRPV